MDSPKVINLNVEMKIPFALPSQQYNPEKHKYKCSCCGKGYNSQKNNFQRSDSLFFKPTADFCHGVKVAQINT